MPYTSKVEVRVPWDNFEVGMSFFVPTLNPGDLFKQIRKEAKTGNIELKYRREIREGMIGIRIWRVK